MYIISTDYSIKLTRMSNIQNRDLCYPETCTHEWSLTHLQASLHVSDATVLNMTSRRTELIPQQAVKYEVRWKETLCDKRKYAIPDTWSDSCRETLMYLSGRTCTEGDRFARPMRRTWNKEIRSYDLPAFFSSFALEENSLFIIFFQRISLFFFSDLFKSSSTWEWGPWFVQKIKTIGHEVNLLILKFTSRKRWMTKWHWD